MKTKKVWFKKITGCNLALMLNCKSCLVLITVILLVSCQAPEKDLYGSLYGTVRDDSTRLPIPEAEVFALTNMVADTTDSLGQYLLGSLAVGMDSLIITAAIYEPYITAVEIIETPLEMDLLLSKQPCIDDEPAADTTYTYHTPSGDILRLDPRFVYALFDTALQDTQEIKNLISRYNLTLTVNSYGYSSIYLLRDQYMAVLCVPPGRRAEYYFTPYGKENFCNFGAHPLVEYSFGVFQHGRNFFFGGLTFTFKLGTTQTQIDSLFAAEGLRFSYKSSGLTEDMPFYNIILTREAKKNILDIIPDLKEIPIVNSVYAHSGWAMSEPVQCD